MQRDSDKYIDVNGKGRETGELTSVNVNHGTTATLTEMQTLPDQQYQTLFETMTQGVVCQDRDGHIIMANPVAQAILGYSLQELRGRTFLELIHGEQNAALDDEQTPLHRILCGEIITSAQAVDILVQMRDGTERRVSISGSPLRDGTGRIIGAIALIQDVTEQRVLERRTQRALDALLSMAEALVQDTQEETQSTLSPEENRPAPLAEGGISRSLAELPCRLLDCQRVGIALLDPEKETLRPLIVVGISPEHELHWRNSLQGARLQNFLGDPRLVGRLRSGQVLSLDTSLPLFRDHPSYKMVAPIIKGNQLIGILLLGYGRIQPMHTRNDLAIIQAIARLASLVIERENARYERDQALIALQNVNLELERANKIKHNFVSMVGHEFRTALTGIQGFSEIICERELTLAEIKEFAVDIHSDARRLGRMINDMLDLDRMEAGRMELSLGWTDLNAIILDVAARIHSDNANHTLRLQLANALPILPGDDDKLTLVVLNLIKHAIKYSPEGGEIVIMSMVEGNMVHVSIRDDGLGIAPVDLEGIFERYTGTGHCIDGTSLGLPMVREIVQMHGGQIWAESLQGEGSIFHFTIPFTEVR